MDKTSDKLRVVIINKSDSTGGAAVVSFRLMSALRDAGVDARMLVAEKLHDSPFVERAASAPALKSAFLRERLSIFLANGLNRDTLFKIDTCGAGVPISRHRWVRQADVICLNWVNQGLISFRGLHDILCLGKPVVWTMHDMWNMTGVCHHAGDCEGFLKSCGNCPLLGAKSSPDDLSYSVWEKKKDLYGLRGIHFVAVSHWLMARAAQSSLMADAPLSVIPNAFRFDEALPERTEHQGIRFLFGAARLDDPIKGLPILVRATEIFAEKYPEKADRSELVTFGNVRNPESIGSFGIPRKHLGVLSGNGVRDAYLSCDVIVSTSLYETLPGTLVEGQAWGCFPVSLDRGGQSDIIDHMSTGYLAHFPDDGDYEKAARAIADGMARAYDVMSGNPAETRSKMLASARSRFSAESVAGSYIDLFNRLLNSGTL